MRLAILPRYGDPVHDQDRLMRTGFSFHGCMYVHVNGWVYVRTY